MIKKSFIILFLLATNWALFGQNNDTWTSFFNDDETLIGYKDKNGAIKIKPKYSPHSWVNRFDNIIIAIEEINNKFENYYLTKSGKIVGRNSMYSFNNTPDCENEGFIRFRDRETDKTGMFDKNGNVAIPAEYSELSNVRNGMIMALKGAEKKYYVVEGEHYEWTGGQELLIDTSNNILIYDFPFNDNLNFFSIEKTKSPHSDATRKSFLAKDGSYYSFVDFEKEFKNWLLNDLLNDLTVDKLISASCDTIRWSPAEFRGWMKSNSREFVNDNFEVLKAGLLETLNPDRDWLVLRESLNSMLYSGEKFETYFYNCGRPKEWIYPVMNIIIKSAGSAGKLSVTQKAYDFLRTGNGYKLILVTIRDEEIK